MTFSQFSELPAELRLKIFRCCSKKDLLNVALVSKQCRNDVLPYTWVSLQIPWHRLETIKDVKEYKRHLKYTERLEFADWSSPTSLEQGYKCFTFYNILRYCNPDKLRVLTFRSFMVAGGLKLVLEFLPAISDLVLVSIPILRLHEEFICRFHYLKVLIVAGSDIEDDAFINIVDLRVLRKLYIRNCKYLTGSCLEYFNKIATHLTVFEFSEGLRVPAYHYEHLSGLKDIEALYLTETQVWDSFFMQLREKLMSLTLLDVSCTAVTDLGIEAISTFASLQDLNMEGCVVTDLGLRHIVKLRKLTRLNIRSCDITDSGMAVLSEMKKLTSLDISNCEITDQGVSQITSLPSLTSLDLYGCHSLTNTSLELISTKLLLLEHIDVTCRRLTIDGLNHLLALPHLKDVVYDDSGISQEDFETFFISFDKSENYSCSS